ncbi:DUF3934 family protein [Paenibacillus glycinis]|uniref:DUF3934 domain-containing protein n=1 Tax=Paenibacillus glycinis TaxID=2697035 RepID=A0ABW9XT00_9BACL|nr:DUF3934 family protein [Paenibacillus glycinis]NBD25759.1 DUF3934 domain-containing protein [Paenibacillus glycinis]
MAKGKGGTGRGTDKKGWTRWQAGEKRLKNAPKPYKSKGTKSPQGEGGATASAAGKGVKPAPSK